MGRADGFCPRRAVRETSSPLENSDAHARYRLCAVNAFVELIPVLAEQDDRVICFAAERRQSSVQNILTGVTAKLLKHFSSSGISNIFSH